MYISKLNIQGCEILDSISISKNGMTTVEIINQNNDNFILTSANPISTFNFNPNEFEVHNLEMELKNVKNILTN